MLKKVKENIKNLKKICKTKINKKQNRKNQQEKKNPIC